MSSSLAMRWYFGLIRSLLLLGNAMEYAQEAASVEVYVQREFTHPNYLSDVYGFPVGLSFLCSLSEMHCPWFDCNYESSKIFLPVVPYLVQSVHLKALSQFIQSVNSKCEDGCRQCDHFLLFPTDPLNFTQKRRRRSITHCYIILNITCSEALKMITLFKVVSEP